MPDPVCIYGIRYAKMSFPVFIKCFKEPFLPKRLETL